jgi:hypothetical protein
MNERGHENSYRAAYHAASAELNEIFREMDQLRIRKDAVDKLTEALKPLLGSSRSFDMDMDMAPAPMISEPVQQRIAEPVPAVDHAVADAVSSVRYETVPTAADPIQSRINSILGLAVA